MRSHLTLKTGKHVELFRFVEGEISASVHVSSGARTTDRGLQRVLRVVDASEDPRIRSVFFDKAGQLRPRRYRVINIDPA